MERSVLEKMNKAALMEEAKKINLRGRSKMLKAELIEALLKAQPRTPSPKKKEEDSILRSDHGFKIRRRTERVPDSFQQEVERGRFDLGVEEERIAEQISVAEPLTYAEELPQGYGDDRIMLLVRDPHWLYTYWEVQDSTIEQALSDNNLSGNYAQKVLRVYVGDESTFHDIDVEGLINNWYIHMGRPDHEFFVDFGIRVEGRFIPLMRSNRVRTPREAMSDVIDDQWVCLEEEARTLYALSGGFRMGEGSLGLQEMMEKRLVGEISSGAISSFFGSGQFRERPRGFWYHLDAELIVYGATEADAKVTLQGRPIQLRPDGTFSARFALPDGKQDIPVTFVSSDEVDQVTVMPKVTRKTDKF